MMQWQKWAYKYSTKNKNVWSDYLTSGRHYFNIGRYTIRISFSISYIILNDIILNGAFWVPLIVINTVFDLLTYYFRSLKFRTFYQRFRRLHVYTSPNSKKTCSYNFQRKQTHASEFFCFTSEFTLIKTYSIR